MFSCVTVGGGCPLVWTTMGRGRFGDSREADSYLIGLAERRILLYISSLIPPMTLKRGEA